MFRLIHIFCLLFLFSCDCTTKQEAIAYSKILIDRLPSQYMANMPKRKTMKLSVLEAMSDSKQINFKKNDAAGVFRIEMRMLDSSRVALSFRLADFKWHEIIRLKEGISEELILLNASRRALKELERQVGGSQSEQSLIRQLKSRTNKESTLRTIMALGKMKSKEAVLPLTELLKQNDPHIAEAALSSLARIGDPSSLQSIIAYAEGKDLATLITVIGVVKMLNDPEAKAWLFVLSTGHPNPAIQAAAAKVLSEL